MASIRGMSDPVKGRVFQLDGVSTTIGRGADNPICLPDPSVSTRHCAIERDDDKYTLQDLDSTNGTRLNGELIKTTRLKPKDIIQAGVVDLLFDGADVAIESAEEAPAMAPSDAGAINTRIERPVPGHPVSGAFAKKRDHRRVINATIYLVAILAVAALVVFVLKLLQT